MQSMPEFDQVSFPGGYDFRDAIVAIKLAAMMHVRDVPIGQTDGVIIERFLTELMARRPELTPAGDPYRVRAKELFDERRSLFHSHLRFSWFALAYWAYGLIAVRSGVSIAEHDGLGIFLTPVCGALRELGIRVPEAECLDEIERFLPEQPSPRSVEASAHVFLSFVRFLHNAALRRRQIVPFGLALPEAGLLFAREDGVEAASMTAFLASHGACLIQQPEKAGQAARLLVLLSRAAVQSPPFWRELTAWRQRPVTLMVVCLMPRNELTSEPPAGVDRELWTWLTGNFAVELGSAPDRYMMLLRALDAADPKRWWWNKADVMEIGLAVDVLGHGIPRPRKRAGANAPTGEAYPFTVSGELLSAFYFASECSRNQEPQERHWRYLEVCSDLVQLRQKTDGEPYALPWFMLIYRAWLAFASRSGSFAAAEEETGQAEKELQGALFALGISGTLAEIPAFLDKFAHLPWATPADSIEAIDESTATFVTLVQCLSDAALARTQRMRLQHPASSCFVSYARADEAFAREFVAFLEAKGADVWWDIHAVVIGAPLDGALRAAVADAAYLFVIATASSDQNSYVRLELDAAIQQGLRIVPIVPEGEVPPGIRSRMQSAPDAFDRAISVGASEREHAFAVALGLLKRSPAKQRGWLQSRPPFPVLRANVVRFRAGLGDTQRA